MKLNGPQIEQLAAASLRAIGVCPTRPGGRQTAACFCASKTQKPSHQDEYFRSANGQVISPDSEGPVAVTGKYLNCGFRKHNASVYRQGSSHCNPRILSGETLLKRFVLTGDNEREKQSLYS